VPVDHEYFEQINNAQWYWYLYNITKDQEEEIQERQNLLEYHASFIAPEAVGSVIKKRKSGDVNDKRDSNFSNTLKNLFGKDIKFKGPSSNFNDLHEVPNILDKITAYEAATKSITSKSMYNFKEWLDFDLG